MKDQQLRGLEGDLGRKGEIKELPITLEFSEAEDGVCQHTLGHTTNTIKESLKSLRAESVDLAANPDHGLPTIPQREAQDTHGDPMVPQPKELQDLPLELARVPEGRHRVLNWYQCMDRSSWLMTSSLPQRERHQSSPTHFCNRSNNFPQ